MRGLNVDQLRTFAEVVEQQSFSARIPNATDNIIKLYL